jgi:hypothetical protein
MKLSAQRLANSRSYHKKKAKQLAALAAAARTQAAQLEAQAGQPQQAPAQPVQQGFCSTCGAGRQGLFCSGCGSTKKIWKLVKIQQYNSDFHNANSLKNKVSSLNLQNYVRQVTWNLKKIIVNVNTRGVKTHWISGAILGKVRDIQ